MTDFFKELEDAPFWQKIMLIIVFAVIVIYTYKNIVFFDKYREIKTLNKKIKIQDQNISSYQFKLKNKPTAKITKNKQTITPMAQNEYAMFITAISTLDNKYAKIINIRPGVEKKNAKGTQKKLYLSIEGNLSMTISLLEKIEAKLLSSSIDKATFCKRKKDLYYTEVFITTYMKK